ncbi:MAG: hypothetical protein LBQ64_03385 [Bacteroidales bacterium]|jgi:PBP1b-binding outer membrane lipoprotein LpoB|nr:hypothetical protein [Bacteroidales bacterium]
MKKLLAMFVVAGMVFISCGNTAETTEPVAEDATATEATVEEQTPAQDETTAQTEATEETPATEEAVPAQ